MVGGRMNPDDYIDPAVSRYDQSGGFFERAGCMGFIMILAALFFIGVESWVILVKPEVSGKVTLKETVRRRGSESYFIKVSGNDYALYVPFRVFKIIEPGREIEKKRRSLFLKYEDSFYILISLWHIVFLFFSSLGVVIWKFRDSRLSVIISNLYAAQPFVLITALSAISAFLIIMGFHE